MSPHDSKGSGNQCEHYGGWIPTIVANRQSPVAGRGSWVYCWRLRARQVSTRPLLGCAFWSQIVPARTSPGALLMRPLSIRMPCPQIPLCPYANGPDLQDVQPCPLFGHCRLRFRCKSLALGRLRFSALFRDVPKEKPTPQTRRLKPHSEFEKGQVPSEETLVLLPSCSHCRQFHGQLLDAVLPHWQ